MDELQKESSDIFLTSPIIVNSPNLNSRNLYDRSRRRNLLLSKNILSPIKNELIKKNIFNNSLIEEKKSEKSLNSYFTPENFQQYTTSCNKYHHKLDHIFYPPYSYYFSVRFPADSIELVQPFFYCHRIVLVHFIDLTSFILITEQLT